MFQKAGSGTASITQKIQIQYRKVLGMGRDPLLLGSELCLGDTLAHCRG